MKYSQHKIAAKGSERSFASSMVWLGVGAAVGMGVLMTLQALRTRVQSQDENVEDSDALLGTME